MRPCVHLHVHVHLHLHLHVYVHVCAHARACISPLALSLQALVFAVGTLQHETGEVLKEERSHDDL
jgi:hypothetical protein